MALRWNMPIRDHSDGPPTKNTTYYCGHCGTWKPENHECAGESK